MTTSGAMLFVPRRTRPTEDGKTQHRHVLICDPDRRVCKTLARIVNSLGQQAVAATDGSAAVRLCELQQPDLIIIAENMPGMRATDFLDAGLASLLTRRVMTVPRRTSNRKRWLPTLSMPSEIGELQRQLSRLLQIPTRI